MNYLLPFCSIHIIKSNICRRKPMSWGLYLMTTSYHGNTFRFNGFYRWGFPSRRANNAELWCFLIFVMPKKLLNKHKNWWWFVVWDATTLMRVHLTVLCTTCEHCVAFRWIKISTGSRPRELSSLITENWSQWKWCTLCTLFFINKSVCQAQLRAYVKKDTYTIFSYTC